MGYGFKMGGRGVILKPPKLEPSVQTLSVTGAELTKTFTIDWKGDGTPEVASSNTDVATVSLSGNVVTVTFISQGTANITITIKQTKHYLSDEAIIPITCVRSNPTLTLSNTTLPISGASGSGSFTVSAYDGDGALTASSGSTGVATVNSTIGADKKVIVTYVTAGTAVITVSASQGVRYNAKTATCTVTTSKSNPSYTAPTAKTGLTYTRSSASAETAQALLNAGKITAGDVSIQYSADNKSWGSSIPTKTAAGTYTVYWRIVGSDKYNGKASAGINVTIAKRSLAIPGLTSSSFSNIRDTSRTVSSNSNYNSVYMSTGGTWTASAPGTYTVSWSLRNTSSCQWNDGTNGTKYQNWTINYYIYYRGASASSPNNGGTITFVGNKGTGSGNYCNYASGEAAEGSCWILMENKGTNATYKTVTFTLNSAIVAGKTVHIDWYCDYSFVPAEAAKSVSKIQFNIGGTWTNIGSWVWPQSSDMTLGTSGTVSEIRIIHTNNTSGDYGNLHIYRIWVT